VSFSKLSMEYLTEFFDKGEIGEGGGISSLLFLIGGSGGGVLFVVS
jgi:hypothetical protein